jgi:hypothetical protein
MSSRLYSRLLAENVIDPKTGEVIGEYNDDHQPGNGAQDRRFRY